MAVTGIVAIKINVSQGGVMLRYPKCFNNYLTNTRKE